MKLESTLGELLYIGFVAEKGRCYEKKWSRSYRKTIRIHIQQLIKINELFYNESEATETINHFIYICAENKQIGKFYCVCKDIKKIKWDKINYRCQKIWKLMNALLSDVNIEINKMFVDWKRVYMLLNVLHNLPRVYLSKNEETLCELKQSPISEKDALIYAEKNMDQQTREIYKDIYAKCRCLL